MGAVDGAALDGYWRLVKVDGPDGPLDLADIAASVWVDTSIRRLSFQVTNSVSGNLVVDGDRLRFVSEITTAVIPGGVRALVESVVHAVLHSRPQWDVTGEHLTLSADGGSELRYQRLTGDPHS
jgi:hypothetical protein